MGRSRISDVAQLAPGTVTSYSRGELPLPPRLPRGGPLPPQSASARLLVAVPQQALRAALRLAGGDRTRLRIEPDGTVTVANQPRPGTRPEAQR